MMFSTASSRSMSSNLKSAEEIAALTGFDPEVIQFVVRLIDRSEYKRQQAAPGIRISTKALGSAGAFPLRLAIRSR